MPEPRDPTGWVQHAHPSVQAVLAEGLRERLAEIELRADRGRWRARALGGKHGAR